MTSECRSAIVQHHNSQVLIMPCACHCPAAALQSGMGKLRVHAAGVQCEAGLTVNTKQPAVLAMPAERRSASADCRCNL